MADVVWNFKFLSEAGFEALGAAMGSQSIPVATPTAFLMQDGSHNVIF